MSAQWLRYGSGEKLDTELPLAVQQTGLVVLGKEYAGLAQYAGIVPLLDKLARLSPRDIHIIEVMVELMHAENNGK
ncbi:MAG: hypothetical protein Q7U37_04805 [Gallionella sp.]|nr:hypothetical protein [Gallionella sp.]